MKNSCWQKVSINLPVPMALFKPIISSGNLLIVGYINADMKRPNSSCKIAVNDIIRSADQLQQLPTGDTRAKWNIIANATHWFTTLVPNSSPPAVAGGQDKNGITTTSNIEMYDDSSKSWKKIASLSSARSVVAIAVVKNNTIMVIGGYSKGGNGAIAKACSLTTVELGQIYR